MAYMQFYVQAAQFLFEDSQNCLLFPAPALRDAYIKGAAQALGACAEEQHILFRQLQERLCMHIARTLRKPLRVLTFAERSSMYEAFLLHKDIQHAILRLEHCPNYKAFHSEQRYATKLEHILGHYSLIYALKDKKDARAQETYSSLQFIAQRYYEFVVGLGCIDYACATIALCEQYEACTTPSPQNFWKRVFVYAPSFFPLAAHVWLKHFEAMFPHALRHEMTTTNAQHVPNKPLAESRGAPTGRATHTNAFFLNPPQRKEHYMFANVAEELGWAFSTALQLQQRGTLPQKIAFSISCIDEFIQAELSSLCVKYDLALNLQYTHDMRSSATLHAFLKNMEACVTTFMHPEALKNLLLFPAIPWNNRARNIELLARGFRHTCIDDAALERWKGVLGTKDNGELKDYFFSLYKALRSMLRATTYAKLRAEFEAFAHAFMYAQNTPRPFFGKTMHRILEILDELSVHEVHVRGIGGDANKAFKGAHAWAVLCAVARRRSTMFEKHENAIFVYQFPDSLGTYYEHHFFLNLSQEGIKKASAPPVLFHEITDAELFEKNPEGLKHGSEMAAAYKNAMENAGAYVYISSSREDYKGTRITPTEWNFTDYEKHDARAGSDAATVPYDPWRHEQQLWSTQDPCAKALAQLQCTKAQRRGMQAQQYTRRNTHPSVLRDGLFTTTQKIIQENSEERTIAMGSIARLMADPMYFLLQSVFRVKPLFEDLRENLDMPLMLGNAFHAMLARLFSKETECLTMQELVEETLKALRAHAFVEAPLRAIFEDEAMHEYLRGIRAFLQEHAENLACKQIKTEESFEVFLHRVFPWADGNFSKLRMRGRSDALLCSEEHEVRYLVDYKIKMKTPLSYFAQLWMYASVHAGDAETGHAPYALFLLLKNFHKAKTGKKLELRTPTEKEQAHIAHYEGLLQHSLAHVFCEGAGADKPLEGALYETQDALVQELFEDLAYDCIARKNCYIYKNYMRYVKERMNSCT